MSVVWVVDARRRGKKRYRAGEFTGGRSAGREVGMKVETSMRGYGISLRGERNGCARIVTFTHLRKGGGIWVERMGR